MYIFYFILVPFIRLTFSWHEVSNKSGKMNPILITKIMFRFVILLILPCLVIAKPIDEIDVVTQTFSEFLEDISIKAIDLGISQKTLDKVFLNLTPNPKVIVYDRRQPEFTQTFWNYLNKRVSEARINKGRLLYKKHKRLLEEITRKYGVQGQFLIAFWGLETNFGQYVGKLSVVRSLATLAYDLRRRDFFTKQLLVTLELIDKQKIPFDVKGSWAGAMGWTQFMPSNIKAYGVDADKNGQLELWSNLQDVFSSSAYFLSKVGWKAGEKWGREVKLPENFHYQIASLKNKKTISEWKKLGVKDITGEELPESNVKSALVLPVGHRGPVFLVYKNFHTILNWNRSILYAVAVGHLSDRILGLDKFKTKVIVEQRLNKKNVLFIQEVLNSLGFDSGEPDGVAGPKTRQAVREYQQVNNLPADGYVGYNLFQRLQQN
jgi:membrane-bound lytic murein transglycosylase B